MKAIARMLSDGRRQVAWVTNDEAELATYSIGKAVWHYVPRHVWRRSSRKGVRA